MNVVLLITYEGVLYAGTKSNAVKQVIVFYRK